jgi:hypothetical protein
MLMAFESISSFLVGCDLLPVVLLFWKANSYFHGVASGENVLHISFVF